MGKVSKNLSSLFRVPAWASFFTPGQYADFTRLITEDLKGRGLSWKEEGGVAVVRRGGGKAQRVGLLNLAQICRGEPLSAWPGSIAEFMTSVLKVDREIEHMISGLKDFSNVKDKIKIRMHPEDYKNQPGSDMLLLRKVADGISALVVCDMGMANISVAQPFAEQWGVSPDELFDLGLKNVRAREPVVHTDLPPLGGFPMEGLEGQSNYAATHVLCLEDHCPRSSGYGMVVTVPNRHLIFYHQIRDDKVSDAMSALHTMTAAAYKDGPGSISPSLYWWRKDRPLSRLLMQRTEDRLHFFPDEEFQREVLVPMMSGN